MKKIIIYSALFILEISVMFFMSSVHFWSFLIHWNSDALVYYELKSNLKIFQFLAGLAVGFTIYKVGLIKSLFGVVLIGLILAIIMNTCLLSSIRHDSRNNNYYIVSCVGKKEHSMRPEGHINTSKFKFHPWDNYVCLQNGYKSDVRMDVKGGVSDTILSYITYKNHLVFVYNYNPSSFDIKKYMEPVLYIDSVEQPRPEYDDIKMSDGDRKKLLYKYRLNVVPVVKKEHDMFLRNLVTFQINDTLQKTVNLMYKDEKDFEKIFDSLDKDSKVIVKVSEINPKVIEVVSWMPTDKDIKGLRNVVEVDKRLESEIMADSASIKLLEKYAVGVQSTKKVDGSRIATVVKLSKKNFKRNMKTLTHYYVQIEDSTFKSEPIELDEINGKYIFYKLQEGSKVVYRKKEDGSTEVLNWTPTQEEVKLYNSAL